MHVFSAGNMGTVNCNYGAAGWGNITGGHKQSKNSIATANLYADFALEATSSRGPAYDGRLKPDISAHGQDQGSTTENHAYQVFGGTSGAAPGIAGCLAQLAQAYQQLHPGEDAPMALLKAALLNTANEIGNFGPDFKYGWGSVNVWRALRLLEQGNFLKGSVAQDSAKTYPLNIPAGLRQAKIMLVWLDPPASPGASKALLNDLDLTLDHGPLDDTIFYPFKLNPAPALSALDATAKRGRDSLNNVEQVSLENPAAFAANVYVSGHAVPFGPQEFYLVWEFLEDKLELTYPAGGEHFVPGETERIHWDADNSTGDFLVEFSPDGAAWQTLATVLAAKHFYEWKVPNSLNANTKLRVSRSGKMAEMAEPFHIMPQPKGLEIVRICPDSFSVKWSKLADTLAYDVYAPGAKYMEIVGQTTDTTFTLPIQGNAGEIQFFSVRAKTPDGKIQSRRAYAAKSAGGLLGCEQPFDLAVGAVSAPSLDSLAACSTIHQPVSFSLKNSGTDTVSGATAFYQLTQNQAVSEALPALAPGDSLTFTFAQVLELSGTDKLDLKIWVDAPGDILAYNDTLSRLLPVFTVPKIGLHGQAFEGGSFPPLGWHAGNPDGDKTWQGTNLLLAGSNGQTTHAVYLNCFNYSAKGAEDYLYMVPSDLAGIAKPALAFDVAHAQFNSGTHENLRVEVFADCDLTAAPTVIFQKADPELSTVGTSTTQFFPDAEGDWRTEIAPLDAFTGKTVIVRFVGLNDFGNNIFLDNVRLIEATNVASPQANFAFSRDTICRADTMLISSLATGDFLSYQWTFGPQGTPATASGKGPHKVMFITPGTKTVRLIVQNPVGSDTLTRTMTVLGLAFANFTSAVNQNSVQFTNQSSNADSYLWDFGDGQSSTEANPTHVYASTGNFPVKLTATNRCKVSTKTATVAVTTLGATELPGIGQFRVFPNPTSGAFWLEISAERAAPLTVDLLDASGRLLEIWSRDVPGGVSKLRFENFCLPADGVYQLRVSSGPSSVVCPLVVER